MIRIRSQTHIQVVLVILVRQVGHINSSSELHSPAGHPCTQKTVGTTEKEQPYVKIPAVHVARDSGSHSQMYSKGQSG